MLAQLVQLRNKLDPETVKLFGQFIAAALASGDANEYVKESIKSVLERPKPPVKCEVEYTVTDNE